MPRVASFTEQALFHPRVLDVVCPAEYKQLEIHSIGGFVIQSLKVSQCSPLKAALRVAYINFVTLTFSRIGTLVNGARTIFSFGQYKLQVYRNGEAAGTESWNKTKGYAYAFFVDLGCALVGSFVTKGIIELTIYSLYTLHITSQFRTFTVPLSQRLLGVFVAPSTVAALAFSASALPRILAGSDTSNGAPPHLAAAVDNTIHWESLNLMCIDPTLVGPPHLMDPLTHEDRYQQFKYDVCVNKWYTEQHQLDKCKPPEAILRLKAGFSYADYAQTKTAYNMAIHPAQHHRTAESKELFKYLEKVCFAIEHNPDNHL